MPRWSLLACAVALSVTPPAAQQAPVFRSMSETVSVYATVQEDGRLVTNLERGDFEILDNGRPQPLTLFDNGVQPISIVVMLDMSGSMIGNLSTLRSAAVQMFTRLLPADKARVGNFGHRITLSPEFTNNQDDLIRALWLDLEAGGPTPLWGAVNVGMTALAHLDGRRVVLVLSDGKDTGPLGGGRARPFGLKELIARAQAEGYMVYAIGMHSRGGPPIFVRRGGGRGGGRGASGQGGGDEPDPGLAVLADASGGGYFELTDTVELGATFAQVADELHRQYLLGFTVPEHDGKPHVVEVRVSRPGATVRARKSYIAPRPKLPPGDVAPAAPFPAGVGR